MRGLSLYHFGALVLLACCVQGYPTEKPNVYPLFYRINGPFFDSTIRVNPNTAMSNWNGIFGVDQKDSLEYWWGSAKLPQQNSLQELGFDHKDKIDCFLHGNFLKVKARTNEQITNSNSIEIRDVKKNAISTVVAVTENFVYVAQEIKSQIGNRIVKEIKVKKQKIPVGVNWKNLKTALTWNNSVFVY